MERRVLETCSEYIENTFMRLSNERMSAKTNGAQTRVAFYAVFDSINLKLNKRYDTRAHDYDNRFFFFISFAIFVFGALCRRWPES